MYMLVVYSCIFKKKTTKIFLDLLVVPKQCVCVCIILMYFLQIKIVEKIISEADHKTGEAKCKYFAGRISFLYEEEVGRFNS